MKLKNVNVLSVLILMMMSNLAFANNSSLPQCDKVYYMKVRQGYQFPIKDYIVSDKNTATIGITNVNHYFSTDEDYNGEQGFPKFVYSNWIKDNKFIVKSGSGKNLYYYATEKYQVKYAPKVRKKDNIKVIFDMQYKKRIGDKWSKNIKNFVRCTNYEITSCGDGILDKKYEQCDPNDPTRTGLKVGQTCDIKTCKPIN